LIQDLDAGSYLGIETGERMYVAATVINGRSTRAVGAKLGEAEDNVRIVAEAGQRVTDGSDGAQAVVWSRLVLRMDVRSASMITITISITVSISITMRMAIRVTVVVVGVVVAGRTDVERGLRVGVCIRVRSVISIHVCGRLIVPRRSRMRVEIGAVMMMMKLMVKRWFVAVMGRRQCVVEEVVLEGRQRRGSSSSSRDVSVRVMGPVDVRVCGRGRRRRREQVEMGMRVVWVRNGERRRRRLKVIELDDWDIVGIVLHRMVRSTVGRKTMGHEWTCEDE